MPPPLMLYFLNSTRLTSSSYNLEYAEDQVPGNHLLHRHVLTSRMSHTHLTRSRSEGPVCDARGAAAEAKIKSVRTVSEQILGQQLRVNPDNLGAALSQNPSFSCSASFSSSFFENPSLPLPFIPGPLKPPSCPFWRQFCFLCYLHTGWAAMVPPKATNCCSLKYHQVPMCITKWVSFVYQRVSCVIGGQGVVGGWVSRPGNRQLPFYAIPTHYLQQPAQAFASTLKKDFCYSSNSFGKVLNCRCEGRAGTIVLL